MAESLNGYLFMREFSTLTEAHVLAGRLAAEATTPDFRLIEVSATAGGAWVCAFDTKVEAKVEDCGVDVIKVDEAIVNAFLSLGPKPNAESRSIGIVEGESIARVFQAALHYVKSGLTLLEIRVKRAGPRGAYAFFAMTEAVAAALAGAKQTSAVLPVTIVPLTGDYKRYF